MTDYGVPNLIQVSAHQVLTTREFTNTMWILNQTGGSFAGAVGAAAPVIEAFYGAIDTYMSNNWGLQELVFTEYDTALPQQEVVAATAVGASANDPLPAQIALCLTLHTAIASKRARGRLYLAGFEESTNGALGEPNGAMCTAIAVAAGNMVTDLGAADVPLVVLSKGGTKPPLVDPFATPVTVLTVNERWDTQRRRNP